MSEKVLIGAIVVLFLIAALVAILVFLYHIETYEKRYELKIEREKTKRMKLKEGA